MAVEEFGRFYGLNNREEELVAEQRYADIRDALAGDRKRDNFRLHQDPTSLKNLSEVRVIMQGYPAHVTVVNAYQTDSSGNWAYPELQDVKDAEQRFARQDWPLGTRIEDTLDRQSQVTFPED
jgi:hypothetical protein